MKTLKNDKNSENRYYLTRDQLDQLYPLLTGLSGTVVPTDDAWTNDRYMTDKEMDVELEKEAEAKEKNQEDNFSIYLLKEIILQKLPKTTKSTL